MNRIATSVFLMAGTILATDILAQTVNIPDNNFKAALLAVPEINLNEDDQIQVSEASQFNDEMYVGLLNISDLTGIEAFTALTGLYCSSNNLTQLDLSSNLSLSSLNVFGNDLEALDVSFLPDLAVLWCDNNLLTTLNVSNNPLMALLYCGDNPALTFVNAASGGNQVLLDVNMMNTPLLTCIQVDDPAFSAANWANVPDAAAFSIDCGIVSVLVGEAGDAFLPYPNPAHDMVRLGIPADLQVLDLSGRVVLSVLNAQEIDLSSLAPGTYVLSGRGASGVAFSHRIQRD